MEPRFDFTRELQGLPADVAAELEDHLLTVAEAAQASGATPDEARARALEGLGDPARVGTEMVAVHRDPVWGRRRLPLSLKVVAAVWAAFGLGCLGRLCTHADPSYVSIGVCLVTGLLSSLLAVGLLRRRERVRRLMVGFLMTLCSGAVLAAVMRSEGGAPVLVTPDWLLLMAVAAMISAWVLSRRDLRGSFT